MSELTRDALTNDITDFCIDFANEVIESIEFRIEHEMLDNVEDRLRKHGYVKERTCAGCVHESGKIHMPLVCETCCNAWTSHYTAKLEGR